jgi:hypothetical protein
MSGDAKQCPWCERWCLKDDACNYIFACGLETAGGTFIIGAGCGRSWCWSCGKKFCGVYYDPVTGLKSPSARDQHGSCCVDEAGFTQEDYCPGGHNSHCAKRF